jgi:hypothetical protein
MPSFGIPIKLFVGIGYQFGKSASTTKRNNQPEQSQSSETSSQVYDKSTIKKQSESSSSNEILNQVPSQQTLQAKPVSSGTMFVSKDTISLEGRNWYCGDNLIKTKKDWADLYSNNPAALSKWNTAKTLQWCGMGVGVVGIVYECIGLGTMISAAGMPITTEEELAAQTKKSNQADGQLFTGVGIVLLGGLAFYLPAFFCEKSARNIYNTSKKQHEPKLNLELGTNSVRLCYNF